MLQTINSWWHGYLSAIGRGPVANEYEWHERRSFWPGRAPSGERSHIYRRRKLPDGSWQVEYVAEPDESGGYWP